MSLHNRDFLGLKDFTREELEGLLDLALAIKSGDDRTKYLDEKTLGMLFTVPSTRTRISFQVAARQLGGHAEAYDPGQLQMSNNETLIDTAEVMNRYLDAIVIRLYDMKNYGAGRRSLELFAEHADVPIVNALDDKEHPCQIMADLLTLRERFGKDYKKKKVVLTWAFAERQKSPGVTHSWLMAASILGLDFTLAFPKGFEPDPEYDEFARRAAESSGAEIVYSHDLDEASEGADVIYAKSWKALAHDVEGDRALRQQNRDDWRVGRRHFDRANPGAVFMDCMPLIRGDEADADVVDGPMSIRYDEAENRLHAQKAILARLVGEA